MRSAIAFLLCVVVAQLSWLTTDAFSLLQATRAIAPTKPKTVAKAPAKKAAPVKKAAPAKKAADKKVIKVARKSPFQPKAKQDTDAKAKAVSAAKAKAQLKAQNKAKANAALQAKRKAAQAANAKAAAAAKVKSAAEAKKAAAAKAKRIRAQSKNASTVVARNVLASGTDASLAVTKNFKPKKVSSSNKPLFPGLQGSAKPAKASSKANTVVAKKPLSPLDFGLKVARSKKGQEATGILIEGGLKLVEAIIEEGKTTRVEIPRGFTVAGQRKKPKVSKIGYRELLDAGIFAGTEFLEVAKTNYDRFYVGTEIKERVSTEKARVTRTASGKENYVVKVGGQSVMVSRNAR